MSKSVWQRSELLIRLQWLWDICKRRWVGWAGGEGYSHPHVAVVTAGVTVFVFPLTTASAKRVNKTKELW